MGPKKVDATPTLDKPPTPPAEELAPNPNINVDIDEAMRRFAPFVFTVDTDNKDTVELKGVFQAMTRDAVIGPNLFVIDRADVLQWFSQISDSSVEHVAEVKAQLATLTDSPNADATLISHAIYHRVKCLAIKREEARLEELEAARLAHEELVERLMDDGLTRSEAEKAAEEEEEAAKMAEDGLESVEVRPMAFVLLKGFPLTAEHVMALHKIGIDVNAMLNLNSKAKFGKREEVPVVDPKAKGKKPDPKKADPKKKGKEESSAIAVDSLIVSMQAEITKIPTFEIHPFSHTAIWVYEVPSQESATQVDEATGNKLFEPLEAEGEATEKMLIKVISLEAALNKYKVWFSKKTIVNVPRLDVHDGEQVDEHAHTGKDEPAEATNAKADKKAAPAPPPKKGKGKGAEPEAPKEELVKPPPPPPPPLPHTMGEVAPEMDVYRRLIDEVSPSNIDQRVMLHCILEQVQVLQGSNGEGSEGAAASVAESIASKNRKDVADFVDYVLAQLDGTQEQTFEATRMRRLKAAQHKEKEAGSVDEAAMDSNCYCDDGNVKLLPASDSKIDGDALLLGLPLKSIVGRLNQTLQQNATALAQVIRTDNEGMRTYEGAHRMLRQLLTEKCGLNDHDAIQLLESRTHAEVLSAQRFSERCNDVFLHPNTARVLKGQCLDGSGVLVVSNNYPEARKRWRAVWDALHGTVTFPQWLKWVEHVEKEDLFFNPPPRDDDDDFEEEEPLPDQVEDDEDEEEEEVVLDDDGEPLLNDDGEVVTRKKEKKPVKLEPEYVDYDKIQSLELRRRATLEHLRRRLQNNEEVLLLANNHTTSVAHQEESFMFPEDGCTIATSTSNGNTKGVSCTVHTNNNSLLFGFRSSVTLPDDATAANGNVSSGVFGIIGVGSEATLHIEATAPQPVVIPGQEPSEPVEEKPVTPKVTPRPGKDGKNDGKSATKDAAKNAPQPSASPAAGAANDGDHSTIPPATPREVEMQYSPATTSITCATVGLTIAVNSVAGSVHFTFDAPRDSPVTVYNPLTQQIQRVFTSEVARTILTDGTVLCKFEDGTRMNLFPNGNTAVLHKGIWMITNAQGRRVLKHADGTLSPVVMSLVTTNTDVDTQSKVTTREDGVVTVQYDDGRVLVQHIDGTRMWQDAQRRCVEIESEGLPLVVGSPKNTVDGQSSNLLCVKFSSGLYISIRVGKRVSIGHFHLGFQSVVDLENFTFHTRPSQESEVTYAVDYAYGGLRCEDSTHTYKVMPFGRTRARTIADENQPPPEDPTVREVIEVFQKEEIVSKTFANILTHTGVPIEKSLHVAKTIAGVDNWDADVAGFAPPPRSRQLRDKERGSVQALRRLVPNAPPKVNNVRDPFIYILLANGMAIELSRREDIREFVKGAVAHSDLLHSDVYHEGFNLTRHLEKEIQPTKKNLAAAEALSPATTPRDQDVPKFNNPLQNDEEKPEPLPTDGFENVIVSIAAARPNMRQGIPKIILDIRSGSSSAPMTVAHFLQELRQGAASQQTNTAAASGDGFDPMTVSCSTRHFVVAPISTTNTSGEPHEILTYNYGADLYKRALEHLAKAIPPVIAAQLSVARTAQIVQMGKDGIPRRTLSKDRSRGSRGSSRDRVGTGSTLPRKKGDKPVSVSGAPIIDTEFATQMEEAKAAEMSERKPWPTPIEDKKTQLHNMQSCKTNYWQLFGQEHVEPLQKENQKFKVDGGKPSGHKLENATAAQQHAAGAGKPLSIEEKVLQKATSPSDAPPTPPPASKTPEGHTVTPPKATPGSFRPMKPAHFVNPGPLSTAHLAPAANDQQGSSFSRRLTQKRVVATPQELHLGTIMQGFRYSTNFQLTNVSVGGTRFRVTPAPSDASWLSVDAPRAPVAAGMSSRISIEVDGNQPLGEITAELLVSSEGGTFIVPVHLNTRGQNEAPVTYQLQHVRLIGPSPMQYVPGRIKVFNQDQGGDVDADKKQQNDYEDDSD